MFGVLTFGRFYHNTVFDVIKESHRGDLYVVSAGLTGRGWNMTQQNANSVLINSVAQNTTYQRAVPAQSQCTVDSGGTRPRWVLSTRQGWTSG